jgi:pimeloyl-ACP methyl ester carboxylesterase
MLSGSGYRQSRGHSDGASIALIYAAMFSDTVSGVVVLAFALR